MPSISLYSINVNWGQAGHCYLNFSDRAKKRGLYKKEMRIRFSLYLSITKQDADKCLFNGRSSAIKIEKK